MEFINDYNNDERVSAGIAVFSSVYKGEKQANYILEPDNRKDYDNFLIMMNKLEILAIGLKYKIYDEKMIKDCFGYDLFITYTRSKSLIDIIRGKDVGPQSDKAYEEFENFALIIGIAYKK